VASHRSENNELLSFLTAPADGVTDQRYLKARESLWEYCRLMGPKFFKAHRHHLMELADTLQALYEGKLLRPNGLPYKKMAIDMGPRLGKSYSLSMFTQWIFGKSAENRVISVSYNETLAMRFARGVRDAIDQDKADPRINVFHDIFPKTKIKYGDASAQLWSLEGQFFNYLATGFGGTITGVGCNVLIIDDPIKNHMEAANDRILEEQWRWYSDTILSRVEEGGIQIVNMTRWAEGDLVGRLIAQDADKEWYVLKFPVCLDEMTHEMLCPDLMSWERYEAIKKVTSLDVFLANYQQDPQTIHGQMYPTFRTYKEIPTVNGKAAFDLIFAYTDTADTGADNLCSFVVGRYQGQGLILDVLFSEDPMEITETQTADMHVRNHVEISKIESNNGGRGFGRNVERLCWERHKWRGTTFILFTQSENKAARILTHSADVMRNILWPEDWEKRWPKLARALKGYKRVGVNAHDDAPDALTGVDEMLQGGISTRNRFHSGRGAVG
jgi:predicted phage terminase large subunit-like protein